MRDWGITGNSNVAIQTESTYISDSMPDITTIPTANLGFTTTASSQKVSTSEYNIEPQPEIAMWPPKPEIVVPLELQQNFNGKSEIFMASPKKNVAKWLRQWPRIGKGSVVIKTGNRYLWNYDR